MQIQNSYASCPNFGMAMKITRKAEKALKEASIQTLVELQEIGRDLKNTKYYHLEIGENLIPKIVSVYKTAYLPPFNMVKPAYKSLLAFGKWGGDTGLIYGLKYDRAGFVMEFENSAQALEAYEKISSMSEHKQAAEFVKLLDKQMLNKPAK